MDYEWWLVRNIGTERLEMICYDGSGYWYMVGDDRLLDDEEIIKEYMMLRKIDLIELRE